MIWHYSQPNFFMFGQLSDEADRYESAKFTQTSRSPLAQLLGVLVDLNIHHLKKKRVFEKKFKSFWLKYIELKRTIGTLQNGRNDSQSISNAKLPFRDTNSIFWHSVL